jgi:hypothetical protein
MKLPSVVLFLLVSAGSHDIDDIMEENDPDIEIFRQLTPDQYLDWLEYNGKDNNESDCELNEEL